MKPTLSVMDFVVIAVVMLAVSAIAHFVLTHDLKSADGATVAGKLNPTLLGGKKK